VVRLPLAGAAVSVRHGRILIASVGVSPPNLFLFRCFPSVPFVIRAEAALANASTGICLLPLGMEHRIKSVVTVQNSGVA
jgi:hypothetical protein